MRGRRSLQTFAWVIVAAGFLSDGACRTAQAQPSGRKLALLVGVSEYRHGEMFPKLECCENDVYQLEQILTQAGYSVTRLSTDRGLGVGRSSGPDGRPDPKPEWLPERYKIQARLEELLSNVTPSDDVFVAFSGHGVQIGETRYFCPYDARLDKAEETLLPLDEVIAALEKSEAGVKVLVCDACRDQVDDLTVRLAKNANTKSVGATAFAPVELAKGRGLIALFSCSSEQKAYVDEQLDHSVFFHYLIKGLQGKADDYKDHRITAGELTAYLNRHVSAHVLGRFDAQQNPHFEINQRGESVLLHVPVVPPPGCEPAEGAKIVPVKVTTDDGVQTEQYWDKVIRTVQDKQGNQHRVVFRLIPQRRLSDPASFYMMEDKVWNGLYRAFAEQNPQAVKGSDWQTGAETAGGSLGIIGKDRLPVFNVRLAEAHAFATWLGGRLPSADEWDQAAGYRDWVNAPDRDQLGGGPFRRPAAGAPDIAVNCFATGPRDVGTAKDDVSPYGCRDMAGNGMEFTGTTHEGRDLGQALQIRDEIPLVQLRGCSYTAPAQLKYDEFMGGVFFFGVSNAADPHYSFRVVLRSR